MRRRRWRRRWQDIGLEKVDGQLWMHFLTFSSSSTNGWMAPSARSIRVATPCSPHNHPPRRTLHASDPRHAVFESPPTMGFNVDAKLVVEGKAQGPS